MDLQTKQHNLTEELVREISSRKGEPAWMLEKRLSALSSLSSLEPMQLAYGMGIHIDASAFSIENIDPSASLQNSRIDIKPPDGVIVKDLHEALGTHGNLIRQHMAEQPSTLIQALNDAFWTRGLFIHIPRGAEPMDPVYYKSVMSKNTLLERILIVAEPMSRADIVEVSESAHGVSGTRIQSLGLFAGESSGVRFCCIQCNGSNVINFSERKASASKDSSIDWTICDIGGSLTKSDVTTRLDGQGAGVKNIGIFLGGHGQQFDFAVSSIHAAPNTKSDMLTKGALSGKSKTVYRGYIKIRDSAARSSGYQKADIILLSPDAEADPIPNLEIDNNDIEKCTHGATVGQIDKEKLFYMMSRGLSEKEAIRHAVHGLFEPAMGRIAAVAIKSGIREIIEKRLEDILD